MTMRVFPSYVHCGHCLSNSMVSLCILPYHKVHWYVTDPLQEIYPPKVTEFAYVTDGACIVPNILDTELVICKVRGMYARDE